MKPILIYRNRKTCSDELDFQVECFNDYGNEFTFLKNAPFICNADEIAFQKEEQLSTVEAVQEPQQFVDNPLVDGLTREACQCEGIDETVASDVAVEQFKTLLPQFLSRLSEKEGTVLKLKFFEERKAVEIAKKLGVSKVITYG